MPYDKFFKQKLDTISTFISSNQTQIDSDPDFRESIRQRIICFAKLSAMLAYPDTKISTIITTLKAHNLTGVLKFFSTAVDKIVVLASDDATYIEAKHEAVITTSPDTLTTVASFMEAFDATPIAME